MRETEELLHDPIHGALHIPLAELPARISEVANDKLVALVCSGNIRSRKGAEMLQAFGFENICVLDRFSFGNKAA